MARPRDYYDVLGLKRNASAEEIRRGYRALVRTLHPDVNKAADAAQKFSEVQEAYDVLSDTEKRRLYDQFGHAGVGVETGETRGSGRGGRTRSGTWSNADAQGGDFGSIFEELFGNRGGSPFRGGGGGSSARAPAARGEDHERELIVSFMVAANGGKEQIPLAGPDGQEIIDVQIPRGIETGKKLRVRGKGRPGRGGRGDLLLTIRVGEHPWFRREGLDLFIDVPITIAEAVLGTTISVPLLKGRAEVRIPPGAGSGRKLRLRGKGLTNEEGAEGDFYAVVQIAPPAGLTDEDRALFAGLGDRLVNPRSSSPWIESPAPREREAPPKD